MRDLAAAPLRRLGLTLCGTPEPSRRPEPTSWMATSSTGSSGPEAMNILLKRMVDRLVRTGAMAVGALVFLGKGVLEMAHLDRAVRHRHGQLVALALVVQSGRAAQAGAVAGETFGRELIARLFCQRAPCRLDLAEVGLAQQPAEGAGVVMFYVGVEQAER